MRSRIEILRRESVLGQLLLKLARLSFPKENFGGVVMSASQPILRKTFQLFREGSEGAGCTPY